MTDEIPTVAHDILVSLDTSVTPHVLHVHDTDGSNSVPRKPGVQEIRWKLDDTLKHGTFVPMAECRPGFEWLSSPPPSSAIFGEPKIESGGNALSITDRHDSDASNGTWIYKLRVKLDDVIYETVLEVQSPMPPPPDKEDCEDGAYAMLMVKDNPVIINK